jgi:hypothetical protein
MSAEVTPRRFPPPWTVEELDAITANQPMNGAARWASTRRKQCHSEGRSHFKQSLTRNRRIDKSVLTSRCG